MLDVTSHLSGLAGPVALALIMAIIFAESGLLVGFFLPGDSMLFSVGVLIASGVLDISPVLAVAAISIAAIAGDQTGYGIGRRLGPRVFSRPDSRLFARRHADRAHEFFVRNGPKAVVLARFVPIVRTFVPTVAGVGRMPYRRFVVFNVTGGLLWVASLVGAGYTLGGVPVVADNVEIITIGIVVVTNAPLVWSAIRAWRHRRT